MNVLSKKVKKNREKEIALRGAELFLDAAILTADDIWGVDRETTEKFVHGYAEIVNGYGAKNGGGLEAIRQEMENRGIEVKI